MLSDCRRPTSLCLSNSLLPSNCSDTTATVKLDPQLQSQEASAFYCPASSHTAAQHKGSLTRLTHPQPSAKPHVLNTTHSCEIRQPVSSDHSPHLWLQVCWKGLAKSGRRTPCRPILLTGHCAPADAPAAARFAGRPASPLALRPGRPNGIMTAKFKLA